MTASYPNPEAPEPGFHSWESISPAKLREIRTSVKYSRFPEHILPMFVAEMDFPVAKEVRDAVSRCVDASDFGYLSEPGELRCLDDAGAACRCRNRRGGQRTMPTEKTGNAFPSPRIRGPGALGRPGAGSRGAGRPDAKAPRPCGRGADPGRGQPPGEAPGLTPADGTRPDASALTVPSGRRRRTLPRGG